MSPLLRRNSKEYRDRFYEERDRPASRRVQVDALIPLSQEGDDVWEQESIALLQRFREPPGFLMKRTFELGLEVRKMKSHQADIRAALYADPETFEFVYGTKTLSIMEAICGPCADLTPQGMQLASGLRIENEKRRLGLTNEYWLFLSVASEQWNGWASKRHPRDPDNATHVCVAPGFRGWGRYDDTEQQRFRVLQGTPIQICANPETRREKESLLAQEDLINGGFIDRDSKTFIREAVFDSALEASTVISGGSVPTVRFSWHKLH